MGGWKGNKRNRKEKINIIKIRMRVKMGKEEEKEEVKEG